jgi:hypothetical protein
VKVQLKTGNTHAVLTSADSRAYSRAYSATDAIT